MKIIARLYQPLRGSILVMGNPVNQINLTDEVVYMEQEPKVMGGTIRMQLTMGLMNDKCVDNPLKLFREMCKLQETLEDNRNRRVASRLTDAKLSRQTTKAVLNIVEGKATNKKLKLLVRTPPADEHTRSAPAAADEIPTSEGELMPEDSATSPVDRKKETPEQRALREMKIQWALFIYQLAWLLRDQVDHLVEKYVERHKKSRMNAALSDDKHRWVNY